MGQLSATVEARDDGLDVSDLRLTGGTQDARGAVHCQRNLCRLRFRLESNDAAATLEDFGFRPDLTAAEASLAGEIEWRLDQPTLASAEGHVNMQLTDGVTRGVGAGEGSPFALLSVPALVSGMIPPATQAPQPAPEPHALRFSRLDADFKLHDGQASTSNLHFDWDAEILMRGRTGLVARDYDQQVWILRGEERLPAAVRRFGATPRVAAVWLSLRELFTGARDARSRAILRLQGSWDDPIVVAEAEKVLGTE
jgi:uncharacterized protein YhdP